MSSFAGTTGGVALAEGVKLGSLRDESKLAVVSIDFGTAYSGIAFSLRSNPESIKYGAPTATDAAQVKVPTILLESPGDNWRFGNDAEDRYNETLMGTPEGETPNVHLYRGFKMVLKDKETGFETLEATSAAGKTQNLLKLVMKSLEFLKDFAIQQVQLASQNGVSNPKTDIQWVVTVPAIWNDFGKAFMRKAAFQAGMVDDEQSDDLMLVLEPEGAALAVHVGASQHSILGVDSRFLVLDCGGGTIDITVHEVQGVRPLVLEAIAPPSGSAWGGQKVNEEFRAFLQELLGPELFDEQGALLSFHTVYGAFERIKLVYEPDRPVPSINLVDVLDAGSDLVALAAAWNQKHPDKTILPAANQSKGYLTMSRELMLSFFEPSLRSTVTEARKVLNAVEDIQYIIVVGGFGSSKVLIERVRKEFHAVNGVQVILPDSNPKPQGAIAHGAVYFGMYADIVASRVAAYTYGIAVQTGGIDDVFRVLVTKNEKLGKEHELMLVGRPISPEQETVTWSLYRSDETQPASILNQHHLGDVVVPCPPHPNPAQRKQRAYFRFGRSEITVRIKDVNGVITRGAISM